LQLQHPQSTKSPLGRGHIRKWSAEEELPKRGLIVLCALLGLAGMGWLGEKLRGRDAGSRQESGRPPVLIVKQPAVISTRSFVPAAPPADMPPLSEGDVAECDSNFVSDASVSGESRKEDATHATVTITHVNMTLELRVGIWLPDGATQRVIDHEDGHRQISEYFYQSADKIADQIAQRYVGKQVEITGSDLNAESSKTLQQMAAEITDKYGKELNPGPTQLLYDTITDHSRNDIVAKDAAVSAINNAAISAIRPTTNPGN
jgi:hypothetical protein